MATRLRVRPRYLHASRLFFHSSGLKPSLAAPSALQTQFPRRRIHTSSSYFQDTVPEPAENDTEAARASRGLIIKLSKPNSKQLQLDGPGNKRRRWDAAWLRDRCTCSACVSPSSGQKSFATAEIPTNINIADLRYDPDTKTYEIEWTNDIPLSAAQGHVTRFTEYELRKMDLARWNLKTVDRQITGDRGVARVLWDRETISRTLRKIEYEDWMQSTDNFWRGVLDLRALGITIVKNVPQSETAVEDIAKKFGAIKETFYGRTWDVISKPEAENIAYTNSYLGLHSDMLYLKQPPQIQLLHCLENSCSGGESIFSDARRTAEEILVSQSAKAKALMELNVQYHYRANGFHYYENRPVLSVNPVQVFWSPPFQNGFGSRWMASAEGHKTSFGEWHVAAAEFHRLSNDERNLFQYRLQPGECVLFDNLRVLHGRKSFDTGSGRRWLKGTYVESDDFDSTRYQAPTKIRAEFLPPTALSFTRQLQKLVPELGLDPLPTARTSSTSLITKYKY